MARAQSIFPGRAVPAPEAARGGGPQHRGLHAAWADPLGRALALMCDGQAEGAESLMRRLAEAGDVDAMERLGAWHLWGPRLLGPGPWRRSVGQAWLERAARMRALNPAS